LAAQKLAVANQIAEFVTHDSIKTQLQGCKQQFNNNGQAEL